jgi:hypothetical protein
MSPVEGFPPCLTGPAAPKCLASAAGPFLSGRQRRVENSEWAPRFRQSFAIHGVLGTAMQKVLEYEQHAAACCQIAAETKNAQYKKQLQDMAEVWDRLAAQRRQGIIENEPNSD